MTVRYRAFLSYSHRDSAFAERFHRDLEGWKADRGLVGRETPFGPAPRTVRPIFRDRDDFAGGRTLDEATQDALRQSDFMILLCSPAAARSPYVNEEVRLFKSFGGAGRIIPVIIEGVPGGGEDECFPEALVRQVDADGRLTDAIEEPLAADAQESGDGRRRALAKVIAGLLGVPFDEIVRRAERAQRRRQRLIAAVATAMTGLAIAAGAMAWLAEQRRTVAERNYQAALSAADTLLGDIGEELIRVEGVRLETTRRLLGRAAGVYDDLMVSVPEADELKLRKAMALAVFAKAYNAKGDSAASRMALDEAAALLGPLDGEGEVGQTAALGLAMVRTRQASADFAAGERALAVGRLEEALERYRRLGEASRDDPDIAFEVATAGMLLARLHEMNGDAAAARQAGRVGAEIVADWRRTSPQDIRWIATEATYLEMEATLAAAAGDRAAAIAAFRKAEAGLRETIAAAPENASVRAMLAESLRSQASLLQDMGDAAGAAAKMDERKALLASLAAGDRENARAQMRAASLTVTEAAKRLSQPGERAAALQDLRAALARLEDAAAAQPQDQEVELALRGGLLTAAGALVDAGLAREAIGPAERYLAFVEADLAATPDDVERLKSVAAAQNALAAALADAGEAAGALAMRLKQLANEQALTAADPSRRGTLANVHWDVGFLLWNASRRAEAIPHYAARARLLDALAAEAADADAAARAFGPERAFAYLNLGELRALVGDSAGAADAFRRSLDISVASSAIAPEDRGRQIDLAWAEARMAQLGDDAERRWRRVADLLVRADAAEPLADLEDELLTVARIAGGARPK